MYCVCTGDHFPEKDKIDTDMMDPAKEILLNWGVEFSIWHDYRFPAASAPLLTVNSIEMIECAMLKYPCWSIVPKTVADYFCGKNLCKQFSIKNAPPNRVSYVLTSAMPIPATAVQIDTLLEEMDAYVGAMLKHND